MCSLAGGARRRPGLPTRSLKIVMWMIEFVFASEQSEYSSDVSAFSDATPG
jgi:hypothetical protein